MVVRRHQQRQGRDRVLGGCQSPRAISLFPCSSLSRFQSEGAELSSEQVVHAWNSHLFFYSRVWYQVQDGPTGRVVILASYSCELRTWPTKKRRTGTRLLVSILETENYIYDLGLYQC